MSEVDDKTHWLEAERCYERSALQASVLGVRNAMLNQAVEDPQQRQKLAAKGLRINTAAGKHLSTAAMKLICIPTLVIGARCISVGHDDEAWDYCRAANSIGPAMTNLTVAAP